MKPRYLLSFVQPRANGDPALRTDTDGALRIFTNGKKLRVSCFVACREIDVQINSAKPQAPDNQQAGQQQ